MKYLNLIILLLFLLACQDKKKDEIKHLVSEWQGKEIRFPKDSITQGTVPFLFFFQSDDKKEIRYLLKKDNFDKPICMDQSDRLNELNHFPADGRFQTFLLDKDNKVVVIGNPIHNPLVILDAATTCGCARPSFDKHPAKPGEILQVRVIMTPKDKGVFDETISVKCNTNQLIKLNIRGMAQ